MTINDLTSAIEEADADEVTVSKYWFYQFASLYTLRKDDEKGFFVEIFTQNGFTKIRPPQQLCHAHSIANLNHLE